MGVDKRWFCFLVNLNFLRRKSRSVEKEIRKAFGVDFLDFAITPDVSKSEDVYAFVKCKSYHNHKEGIRNCIAIKSVLASIDSPCFLSDDEVKQFVDSAAVTLSDERFKVGDIVEVTNGMYKGLHGIVIEVQKKQVYSVLFSFHIRRFQEVIRAQDLELSCNVLSVVSRVPVGGHGRNQCCQERTLESHGNTRTFGGKHKRGKVSV
jgi:transcription antitermination factor NusG